jgi:hypothetical protein
MVPFPPRGDRPTESAQSLPAEALATYLEEWAMRREKVLSLLDIGAAREARKLAWECRRMATLDTTTPEWVALKRRVVAFLGSRRDSHLIRREKRGV